MNADMWASTLSSPYDKTSPKKMGPMYPDEFRANSAKIPDLLPIVNIASVRQRSRSPGQRDMQDLYTGTSYTSKQGPSPPSSTLHHGYYRQAQHRFSQSPKGPSGSPLPRTPKHSPDRHTVPLQHYLPSERSPNPKGGFHNLWDRELYSKAGSRPSPVGLQQRMPPIKKRRESYKKESAVRYVSRTSAVRSPLKQSRVRQEMDEPLRPYLARDTAKYSQMTRAERRPWERRPREAPYKGSEAFIAVRYPTKMHSVVQAQPFFEQSKQRKDFPTSIPQSPEAHHQQTGQADSRIPSQGVLRKLLSDGHLPGEHPGFSVSKLCKEQNQKASAKPDSRSNSQAESTNKQYLVEGEMSPCTESISQVKKGTPGPTPNEPREVDMTQHQSNQDVPLDLSVGLQKQNKSDTDSDNDVIVMRVQGPPDNRSVSQTPPGHSKADRSDERDPSRRDASSPSHPYRNSPFDLYGGEMRSERHSTYPSRQRLPSHSEPSYYREYDVRGTGDIRDEYTLIQPDRRPKHSRAVYRQGTRSYHPYRRMVSEEEKCHFRRDPSLIAQPRRSKRRFPVPNDLPTLPILPLDMFLPFGPSAADQSNVLLQMFDKEQLKGDSLKNTHRQSKQSSPCISPSDSWRIHHGHDSAIPEELMAHFDYHSPQTSSDEDSNHTSLFYNFPHAAGLNSEELGEQPTYPEGLPCSLTEEQTYDEQPMYNRFQRLETGSVAKTPHQGIVQDPVLLTERNEESPKQSCSSYQHTNSSSIPPTGRLSNVHSSQPMAQTAMTRPAPDRMLFNQDSETSTAQQCASLTTQRDSLSDTKDLPKRSAAEQELGLQTSNREPTSHNFRTIDEYEKHVTLFQAEEGSDNNTFKKGTIKAKTASPSAFRNSFPGERSMEVRFHDTNADSNTFQCGDKTCISETGENSSIALAFTHNRVTEEVLTQSAKGNTGRGVELHSAQNSEELSGDDCDSSEVDRHSSPKSHSFKEGEKRFPPVFSLQNQFPADAKRKPANETTYDNNDKQSLSEKDPNVKKIYSINYSNHDQNSIFEIANTLAWQNDSASVANLQDQLIARALGQPIEGKDLDNKAESFSEIHPECILGFSNKNLNIAQFNNKKSSVKFGSKPSWQTSYTTVANLQDQLIAGALDQSEKGENQGDKLKSCTEIPPLVILGNSKNESITTQFRGQNSSFEIDHARGRQTNSAPITNQQNKSVEDVILQSAEGHKVCSDIITRDKANNSTNNSKHALLNDRNSNSEIGNNHTLGNSSVASLQNQLISDALGQSVMRQNSGASSYELQNSSVDIGNTGARNVGSATVAILQNKLVAEALVQSAKEVSPDNKGKPRRELDPKYILGNSYYVASNAQNLDKNISVDIGITPAWKKSSASVANLHNKLVVDALWQSTEGKNRNAEAKTSSKNRPKDGPINSKKYSYINQCIDQNTSFENSNTLGRQNTSGTVANLQNQLIADALGQSVRSTKSGNEAKIYSEIPKEYPRDILYNSNEGLSREQLEGQTYSVEPQMSLSLDYNPNIISYLEDRVIGNVLGQPVNAVHPSNKCTGSAENQSTGVNTLKRDSNNVHCTDGNYFAKNLSCDESLPTRADLQSEDIADSFVHPAQEKSTFNKTAFRESTHKDGIHNLNEDSKNICFNEWIASSKNGKTLSLDDTFTTMAYIQKRIIAEMLEQSVGRKNTGKTSTHSPQDTLNCNLDSLNDASLNNQMNGENQSDKTDDTLSQKITLSTMTDLQNKTNADVREGQSPQRREVCMEEKSISETSAGEISNNAKDESHKHSGTKNPALVALLENRATAEVNEEQMWTKLYNPNSSSQMDSLTHDSAKQIPVANVNPIFKDKTNDFEIIKCDDATDETSSNENFDKSSGSQYCDSQTLTEDTSLNITTSHSPHQQEFVKFICREEDVASVTLNSRIESESTTNGFRCESSNLSSLPDKVHDNLTEKPGQPVAIIDPGLSVYTQSRNHCLYSHQLEAIHNEGMTPNRLTKVYKECMQSNSEKHTQPDTDEKETRNDNMASAVTASALSLTAPTVPRSGNRNQDDTSLTSSLTFTPIATEDADRTLSHTATTIARSDNIYEDAAPTLSPYPTSIAGSDNIYRDDTTMNLPATAMELTGSEHIYGQDRTTLSPNGALIAEGAALKPEEQSEKNTPKGISKNYKVKKITGRNDLSINKCDGNNSIREKIKNKDWKEKKKHSKRLLIKGNPRFVQIQEDLDCTNITRPVSFTSSSCHEKHAGPVGEEYHSKRKEKGLEQTATVEEFTADEFSAQVAVAESATSLCVDSNPSEPTKKNTRRYKRRRKTDYFDIEKRIKDKKRVRKEKKWKPDDVSVESELDNQSKNGIFWALKPGLVEESDRITEPGRHTPGCDVTEEDTSADLTSVDDVCDGTGETALHKAARLQYKDVAVLFEAGKKVDVNVADNAGYTPLHESCASGSLQISSFLIQQGADVNAEACDGTRPLHDAVVNNHVEVVRLLLAQGADPSIRNYYGKSLQELARSPQMVLFLQGYQGDLNGDRDHEIPWTMDRDWHNTDDIFPEMSVLGNLPADDDDSETPMPEETDKTLFKRSARQPLKTFNIAIDPRKGRRCYHLASDVAARLGMTVADFINLNRNLSFIKVASKSAECIVPPPQNTASPSRGSDSSTVTLVEIDDPLKLILDIYTDSLSKLEPVKPNLSSFSGSARAIGRTKTNKLLYRELFIGGGWNSDNT